MSIPPLQLAPPQLPHTPGDGSLSFAAQSGNLRRHLAAIPAGLTSVYLAGPGPGTAPPVQFNMSPAFLPAVRPEVRDDGDVFLVRCGLPSDTFNKAAHFFLPDQTALLRRLPEIEAFFHGQPFTCWVGPDDTPPDLEDTLLSLGYQREEIETGMTLVLDDLAPEWPAPSRPLDVCVVKNPVQLKDYARLMAANWDPPDDVVLAVYQAAAPALLRADSGLRFLVGYSDGVPVCGVEFCLDPLPASPGPRLAGVYGLVTPAPHRRNGFAGSLLHAGLLALRGQRDGAFTHACLQASDMGAGLYRRMGFSPCGRWSEYAPPTTN